jgi:hypothetical protein
MWRSARAQGSGLMCLVVALSLAACVASSPVVAVDGDGLNPAMAPGAVVDRASALVDDNVAFLGHEVAPFHVDSLVLTTGDKVRTHEPKATAAGRDELVWIVRATGTFVGRHSPSASATISQSTGYFVFADRDGSLLSSGMP